MKRFVLIVDANPALSFFFRFVLEGDEFDVECIARGDEAVFFIDRKLPDLVVINWNLPGISGVELCRRLRACEKTKNIPTILIVDCLKQLSLFKHLSSLSNAIKDKSICGAEFEYCVRTVIQTAPTRKLVVGGIILNIEKTCIETKAIDLYLSPIKFRLLYFLMKNPGKIFTCARLFTEAWDPNSDYSIRTVNVHVARLRNDIKTAVSRNPILTVRGSGYYFEDMP